MTVKFGKYSDDFTSLEAFSQLATGSYMTLINLIVDSSRPESVPALDIKRERAAGGYCSLDHLPIPNPRDDSVINEVIHKIRI